MAYFAPNSSIRTHEIRTFASAYPLDVVSWEQHYEMAHECNCWGGPAKTLAWRVVQRRLGSMGLISWVIFGALVGWLGSKLAGTDSQQGWIANIILGIIGAVLGGIVWGWIDDEKFVIDWSIGSLI